jgi:hypothetical protein
VYHSSPGGKSGRSTISCGPAASNAQTLKSKHAIQNEFRFIRHLQPHAGGGLILSDQALASEIHLNLELASKVKIELATARKLRDRNKTIYRLAHWPIWIWVFFLAPGPLTFQLFAYGFNAWTAAWLGAVLLGTGIAGLRGRLPGVEPRPYIIRFTEDKPNPLYRRLCYTFAWSALVTYAVLNLTGLIAAIVTGHWRLRQIYDAAYFPMAICIWVSGALGLLPRVKPSTKGEGHERRYFYGSVWAVCFAQPALGILWVTLPRGRAGDILKLIVFVTILAITGIAARRGVLPRTRRIVPGELAISD